MNNPTITQGKGKYKLINQGKSYETKIWLNCVKCGDWCSRKQYHFCVKCHRDWQTKNRYKPEANFVKPEANFVKRSYL